MKKIISLKDKLMIVGAVIILLSIVVSSSTIKLGNDPSGNVRYGVGGGHNVLVNSNGNVWHIGNETDISDEIQDAIDDLGGHGGKISIGTGWYYINDTVNLNDGIVIEGFGGRSNDNDVCIIQTYTGGDPVFEYNVLDHHASKGYGANVEVRNIYFVVSQDAWAVINISGGMNHRIENVQIDKDGAATEVRYGIHMNATYLSYISNCKVRAGGIACIRFARMDHTAPVWYSVKNTVEHCYFTSANCGVWIDGSSTQTDLFDIDFENLVSAVNLSTERTSQRAMHTSIINCRFEDSTAGTDIVIGEAHGLYIERCHFNNIDNFRFLNTQTFNISNVVICESIFTSRGRSHNNRTVHIAGDNTIFESNCLSNLTVDWGNNIIIEKNMLYPRDSANSNNKFMDSVATGKFYYNISLNGSRTLNCTVRDNMLCGVIDNYADDTHIWNNWYFGGNRLDMNIPSNPIEGTHYYVQTNSSIAVYDGTDWHYLVPS